MDGGHLVGEALNDLVMHPPPLFVVDSKPSHGRPYYELHFYERCGNGALGMEHAKEDVSNVRRCFNCGEPGHEVSSCSQRRDYALISLSRQMYNFFKEESFGSSQRVHEAEGWKRQRLAWLEEFEPGQVRGGLLREALGLRDGDVGEYVEWLGNMAIWGYPKGWIGTVDPRLQVWKIISGEDGQDGSDDSDETLFTITGEDHEELRLPSGAHAASTSRDDDGASTSGSESSGTPLEPAVDETRSRPRRWAKYPNTYFLSSKLFVYNGEGIPEPADEPHSTVVSNTFDAERQALWDRIVNASYASAPTPPLPSDSLPPPPPLSPPPLPPASPPPLPPSIAPPLIPMTTASVSPTAELSEGNIVGDDSDMDLSDAD